MVVLILGYALVYPTVSWPDGRNRTLNQSANVCDRKSQIENTYSEVPNKSVTLLMIFGDFFPTYMVLLGHILYLILEKATDTYVYFELILIRI